MKSVTLILAALLGIVLSETAIEEFAGGNLKFTARLYKELLKDIKGNLIVCPLSIEIILALTQAGAKGATADEFTTSLNLPSTQSRTQQALSAFLPTLKSPKDSDLKLLSANRLFLGEKFAVLEAFQRTATSVFDAGAQNVDYSKPAEAANTINKWVEEHTNNKIRDLLSADSLTAATRLVLVNTLYFSSKWQTQFEKWLTKKEPFFATASDSKNVDMMHLEENFRYYESPEHNVKFLELPYEGDNISMTIILPNQIDGLAQAEQNIEELLKPQPLQQERVAVTLPRFIIESDIQLKPVLQRLGLNTAFGGSADFSGISNEPLYIDDVIQKAFINVSESGTEAAAATAVGVVELSGIIAILPTKYFIVDHPFLYVIKSGGVILFVGNVKF